MHRRTRLEEWARGKRVLQFSCSKIHFGFLNLVGCEMRGAWREAPRFFGNVGAWAGIVGVDPQPCAPILVLGEGGWGVPAPPGSPNPLPQPWLCSSSAFPPSETAGM